MEEEKSSKKKSDEEIKQEIINNRNQRIQDEILAFISAIIIMVLPSLLWRIGLVWIGVFISFSYLLVLSATCRKNGILREMEWVFDGWKLVAVIVICIIVGVLMEELIVLGIAIAMGILIRIFVAIYNSSPERKAEIEKGLEAIGMMSAERETNRISNFIYGKDYKDLDEEQQSQVRIRIYDDLKQKQHQQNIQGYLEHLSDEMQKENNQSYTITKSRYTDYKGDNMYDIEKKK